MKEMKSQVRRALFLGAVAFLSAATAADYEWTGGGDGVRWTQPSNWGLESGWPDGTDAHVVFPCDAEVTVDAARAVRVRDIVVSSGVSLTLRAAPDSSFEVQNGTNDSGFLMIGKAATLNLHVPVDAAVSRLDVSNAGTFNCHARMSNDLTGTFGFLFAGGVTRFGEGADVCAGKTRIYFGNGYRAGEGEDVYHVEGNAKITALALACGASKSCRRVTVVQDGADSSVDVGTFISCDAATNLVTAYTLKRGAFRASATNVGAAGDPQRTACLAVEGGTAELGALDLRSGSVAALGGVVTVTGYANADPTAARFVLGDGWADFHESVTTVAAADFRPTANVTLESGHPIAYEVAPGARTPQALTVGRNVTVKVTDGVTWSGETLDPFSVLIRESGVLLIDDQRAYLAQPMDLTIESGCTGGIVTTDNNTRYARTAFVCHSLTVAGTELAVGKGYSLGSTALKPYAGASDPASLAIVPYVWTGAGGSDLYMDGANWEGGACPPSDQNVAIDLSAAAGGTVRFPDYAYEIGHVVFLPKGHAKEVRLAGTASAHLKNSTAYSPSFIIAEDATVTLDLNLRNTGQNAALTGGGTLKVLKNWPGREHQPVLSVDGRLLFAGATEVCSYDASTKSDILTDFSVWAHNKHYHFDVRFAEGASLTAKNMYFGMQGFSSPDSYCQEGGTVSVEGLYVTLTSQNQNDPAGHWHYRMDGGAFTASEGVYLGTRRPGCARQYPHGRFVLNGGTLTAPKLATELNSNYFVFNGGDVFLGAGGFVKTDTYTTNGESSKLLIPNPDEGLVFGGVAFHAARAGWSIPAALAVRLSGTNGPTTFDIAHDVSVESAVAGPGGLVKRGAGTLTVSGPYSASGAIRVESGCLSFAGEVSGITSLDLASDVSLSLPPGASLTVDTLIVGGTRHGQGVSLAFGAGTVTVGGTSPYAWRGAAGGRWSDAANWKDGRVPDGEDVTLDFAASTIPADGLLIDVDGDVALAGLAACGRIVLTGRGALTLSDGAEVVVPAGSSLTVSGAVHVARTALKRGAGTLTLVGRLRSAADPATLGQADSPVPGQNPVADPAEVYEFRVAEGETDVAGDVAGVRLYVDGETPEADARITVSDGATIVNKASLNLPLCGAARNGYGRIVQNGGTVDMTSGYPLFVKGGNKWYLAHFKGGEASLTLNGGTLTWPADSRCAIMFNLSTDVYEGGGRITVTVNSNAVWRVPRQCYIGYEKAQSDTVELRGGTLEYRSFIQGAGRTSFVLDGGLLSQVRPGEWTFPDAEGGTDRTTVELVGGAVRFAQPGASSVQKIACRTTGAGTVVQAGPGTLTFDDFAARCDYEAQAGTLRLTAPMLAQGSDSTVSVRKGAKADLSFDGAMTVRRVLINGRLRWRESYSSATDPAAFAGTGVLNVTEHAERKGFCVIVP